MSPDNNSPWSQPDLAALAADPNTPLETLRDLAVQYPQLQATIALNPSTYPDLLTWLKQVGDDGVQAALQHRDYYGPVYPQVNVPGDGWNQPAEATAAASVVPTPEPAAEPPTPAATVVPTPEPAAQPSASPASEEPPVSASATEPPTSSATEPPASVSATEPPAEYAPVPVPTVVPTPAATVVPTPEPAAQPSASPASEEPPVSASDTEPPTSSATEPPAEYAPVPLPTVVPTPAATVVPTPAATVVPTPASSEPPAEYAPTPAATYPAGASVPPALAGGGYAQQPEDEGKKSQRKLWLILLALFLVALLLLGFIWFKFLRGSDDAGAGATDVADSSSASVSSESQSTPSATPEPTKSPVETQTPTPTSRPTVEVIRYPAPAGAIEAEAVISPTGNLICKLGEDTVRCTAVESNGKVGQTCASQALVVEASAAGTGVACGESVSGGPQQTLDYNKSAFKGKVACTSRYSGMTCWDTVTGNALAISRAGWQAGTRGEIPETAFSWNK